MLFQTKLSVLALPLLLVACSFQRYQPSIMLVEADIQIHTKGRVRGETYTSDMDDNNGLSQRRRLFADMWSDPSKPGRGGAGAAAKGLNEVVVMRNRVTPAPAPTNPNPVPSPTNPPPTMPPPTNPPPTLGNGIRNDSCAAAKGPVQVTAQGLGNSRAITYKDSTVGARVPDVMPDRCNRITNSAPGVWYSVIGTGHLMTASLCWPGTNFDTKITIYEGGCGGVMTCVNANDDASGNFGACSINMQASRVQWPSTEGTTYHILIHGFGAREGDFEMNVISFRPDNQDPDKAPTLSLGDSVIGTTFQAEEPWNGDSTNCAGSEGLIGDSPSVWYRVMGTGGTLRASTCNPGTEANYNTVLHIFEGGSNMNNCVTGNDDLASPDRCSQIDWASTAGEDYYILVHGRLGDQGLFELSVDSV